MEKSFVILLLMVLSLTGVSQDEPVRAFEYTSEDTTYHMKQYVFCMYLAGAKRSQTDEEVAELQEEHLAHLGALIPKGLQMSGPFGDDTEKRGILLFDLATVDEAAALIEEDPMVKAERLTYECHPLWLAKGTTLK